MLVTPESERVKSLKPSVTGFVIKYSEFNWLAAVCI